MLSCAVRLFEAVYIYISRSNTEGRRVHIRIRVLRISPINFFDGSNNPAAPYDPLKQLRAPFNAVTLAGTNCATRDSV